MMSPAKSGPFANKQALIELMRDSVPYFLDRRRSEERFATAGAAMPPLCIRSALLPNGPINQPREARDRSPPLQR